MKGIVKYTHFHFVSNLNAIFRLLKPYIFWPLYEDSARQAVDYPTFSMVICQVIYKLKLVLLFAAQYLTEWVK